MSRYYSVSGKQYPSVTTVLSIIRRPGLEIWRGNVGNQEADEIVEKATQLGRKVHHYCEEINQGKSPILRAGSPITPIVRAYRNWFGHMVAHVIAAEKMVWSDRYQYAGTADLVAVLKGDSLPAVIDIKTSKSIDLEMALQLAAYREALLEQGIEVGRRLIVRLDKIAPSRPPEIKEFQNHKADHDHFLYALSLWRYFNSREAS